jgi:hypothetical protein
MQESRKKKRFSLKRLFGYVTVACLVVGMGSWIIGTAFNPVFPKSTLDQLKQGMTETEVVRILGKPSHIRQEGQINSQDAVWVYQWGWNPGFVDVYFDSNRRFSSFNDESIEPAR